jgi:soluble lytic murein transglycosylase-like protein
LTLALPVRGAAVAVGALLVTAAAPACASWDCADAFGNHYVVANRFGESADVRCTPLEESASEPAAVVGADGVHELLSAPAPSAKAAGNGRLVLAAAAPRLDASLVTARRRQIDPLIEATAAEFGLDADLLRAVVEIESRFNPNAISPRGAIGLMQVMPSTAASLGLAQPEQALLDPRANLRTGARYLQRLSLQFAGAIELVLAAYNAGEGSVLRNGWTLPPYPETRAYVRDVLEVYHALRAAR